MFLININSFSSEIKEKQISINIRKYYISEQAKKETNFLKDYGVLLTLLTTISLFGISKLYVRKEKEKTINEIKTQLISIQFGILKEIQNVGKTLKEINKNKDKSIDVISTVPSKYSIKLDLMYISYNEKLDKKNIEYLDNLYYINSKFKTAKEHLIKYLSNIKNEYDLLAADAIIKIAEEEIKNLK
jgi:hypothetical protein